MKPKCPRCHTGIIIDASTRYGVRASKCVNCGAFHETGADRASLDRQVTRKEPHGRYTA